MTKSAVVIRLADGTEKVALEAPGGYEFVDYRARRAEDFYLTRFGKIDYTDFNWSTTSDPRFILRKLPTAKERRLAALHTTLHDYGLHGSYFHECVAIARIEDIFRENPDAPKVGGER